MVVRAPGPAPDHTLVLVNGKRRHRAAVIHWGGNGVADGAQGPDIAVIPSIALRQVEVLRDGAAAQYGSDAIAGVRGVTAAGLIWDAGASVGANAVDFFIDNTVNGMINIAGGPGRNGGTNGSRSASETRRRGRSVHTHHSAGVVIDHAPFTLTVDYFRIDLADRLALTELFALTPAEVDHLVAEGVTSTGNLTNSRFFTNDFATTTQGIDLSVRRDRRQRVRRLTISQPARNAATPPPRIRGLGPSGPAVTIETSSSHIPSSCSPRPA